MPLDPKEDQLPMPVSYEIRRGDLVFTFGPKSDFTPEEIETMVAEAQRQGFSGPVSVKFLKTLVQVKRVFPGARVVGG